jgi:hypothetical protein
MPWAREVEVGTSPISVTVHVPTLLPDAGVRASCDPTSGVACDSPEETATGSQSGTMPLPRTIGLVALGVGAAGIGLGVGFAIHARSTEDSAEQAGCNDRGCPDSASLGLRRQAVSAGNWATAGAVIGIAGVATAGILLWMLPEPDDTTQPTARVMPRLTPEVAGLDVMGRF